MVSATSIPKMLSKHLDQMNAEWHVDIARSAQDKSMRAAQAGRMGLTETLQTSSVSKSATEKVGNLGDGSGKCSAGKIDIGMVGAADIPNLVMSIQVRSAGRPDDGVRRCQTKHAWSHRNRSACMQ